MHTGYRWYIKDSDTGYDDTKDRDTFNMENTKQGGRE